MITIIPKRFVVGFLTFCLRGKISYRAIFCFFDQLWDIWIITSCRKGLVENHVTCNSINKWALKRLALSTKWCRCQSTGSLFGWIFQVNNPKGAQYVQIPFIQYWKFTPQLQRWCFCLMKSVWRSSLLQLSAERAGKLNSWGNRRRMFEGWWLWRECEF